MRRKKHTCAQPRVERDETAVSAVSGPTDRLIDRLMLGKRGKSTSGVLFRPDHRRAPYPTLAHRPARILPIGSTWPPSVSSPRARSSAARASTPRPSVSARCPPSFAPSNAYITMPEGDPNALNKWSRRSPSPSPRARPRCVSRFPFDRQSEIRAAGRPERRDRRAATAPALARDQSLTAGTLESAKPQRRSPNFPALRAHRRCSTPPASSPRT